MGLLKSFFTNCANPKGWMGQLMLRFMNFGHAPLTNWGLDLIEFQEGCTMLDIGCGGGATLKRLLKRSKGSRVYGIDISEESVAKARKVNDALLGNGVPDWKRDVRAAAEVAARLCCRRDGGCLVLVTAIACSGDAG